MAAGPFCNAFYEMSDADRYPVGEAVNFAKLPIDFGIIHYASDTPYTQARTLGAGPVRVFLRIQIPMARPAIMIGLTLVAMETRSALRFEAFRSGVTKMVTGRDQGAAMSFELLVPKNAPPAFANATAGVVASRATVTCSPVETRTSLSRSSGWAVICFASAKRRLVSPLIAETTTAT